MKTVNISEAKAKFSALLAEVEAIGTKVRICRYGKPIAELVPYRKRDRLKPHPVMSKIRINYDPTEPLTEEEWSETGQRA